MGSPHQRGLSGLLRQAALRAYGASCAGVGATWAAGGAYQRQRGHPVLSYPPRTHTRKQMTVLPVRCCFGGAPSGACHSRFQPGSADGAAATKAALPALLLPLATTCRQRSVQAQQLTWVPPRPPPPAPPRPISCWHLRVGGGASGVVPPHNAPIAILRRRLQPFA